MDMILQVGLVAQTKWLRCIQERSTCGLTVLYSAANQNQTVKLTDQLRRMLGDFEDDTQYPGNKGAGLLAICGRQVLCSVSRGGANTNLLCFDVFFPEREALLEMGQERHEIR
jgi:hypothetical protein